MKLIDEKLGGTTPLEVILKFPAKEINQTNNTDIWLQDGDEIKLEIDKLGSLVNTIKFI